MLSEKSPTGLSTPPPITRTSSTFARLAMSLTIVASWSFDWTERAAICGTGLSPSPRSLSATSTVSRGSVPGRKVTLTVVPSSSTSAKLSILVAPGGVTSIDQSLPAAVMASVSAVMALSPQNTIGISRQKGSGSGLMTANTLPFATEP